MNELREVTAELYRTDASLNLFWLDIKDEAEKKLAEMIIKLEKYDQDNVWTPL